MSIAALRKRQRSNNIADYEQFIDLVPCPEVQCWCRRLRRHQVVATEQAQAISAAAAALVRSQVAAGRDIPAFSMSEAIYAHVAVNITRLTQKRVCQQDRRRQRDRTMLQCWGLRWRLRAGSADS